MYYKWEKSKSGNINSESKEYDIESKNDANVESKTEAHKNFPEEFVKKVLNEVILPSYEEEINHCLKYRNLFSVTSVICLYLSSLVICLSGIINFLSISHSEYNIYAGVLCLISGILLNLVTICKSQHHKNTAKLNTICERMGIDVRFYDSFKNQTSKSKDSILDI